MPWGKMRLLALLGLIQTACPTCATHQRPDRRVPTADASGRSESGAWGDTCHGARHVTNQEHSMVKIHIERHEAEYHVDGLTLSEGGCLFHLRQHNIPGRLFPLIRRGLQTKHAVTLYQTADPEDWMMLFPLG
jgi:hypothetical protein